MSTLQRLLPCVLVFAGCGSGLENGSDGSNRSPDFTFHFEEVDLAEELPDGGELLNPCGDNDPSCTDKGFGPAAGSPFPLHGDMPPDPNQTDEGVGRDKDGYLGLDSSHASFDFLWLANQDDWSRGTVTKLNSKTLREVARYFSVTCNSLKSGNSMNCDGMSGCCANDSKPQWNNRKANMAPGPAQQVQLTANAPSRTTVDFNGDMWVSNRAFGGQASVTKVSNDPATCIDRNKNGKIDTSTDTNGDGLIQTDCNGDNQPDDWNSVKATPCMNGLAQEFYGLDDECVLITTNTGDRDMVGRPLGLGPGAQDFGPSDAWAGSFNRGTFYRVDGTSGLVKDEVQLPQGCNPYGVVVDSSGYGWAPNVDGQNGGSLCYFNTKKNVEVGRARDPQFGAMHAYGISVDRDQNVWMGGCGPALNGTPPNAYRYTPDRSMGFAKLGSGYWTFIKAAGQAAGAAGWGRGIAADSRTQNSYWVWMAAHDGWIVRIPGSTLPLPNGADVMVDGTNYPAVRVAGSYMGGAGVDRDQNLWGISHTGSVATRVKVDANGMMTVPDVNSPPMGNNKCPAGDRCAFKDSNASTPGPYTYSDFTGFGLRNFTQPKGKWSYVQKGCAGADGPAFPGDTRWVAVTFDAEVPLNTTLVLRARSGNTAMPDQTWGAWTADFATTPADLLNGMPLDPNLKDDGYLQVEFDFATNDKNNSPKLKGFHILYECPGGIG